ncbi:MAG: type II toxin-antitoxin system HicB family antitoxin [Flavobacterium sp.]|nr:type II toxin-antitoxin system HicB family antitoxin [Flavobacterium sp.]
MQVQQYTAHIEKDIETNMFVGIVPAIPGAYTQANTLDELNLRLNEVVALCLENMSKEEIENIPVFIGTQQILVAV